MKYTYVYKTSDGVRHEASMDAESRERVFEALRGQGIRAIKVAAADGSKANGEVRGVRKRMVALSVVIAAALAGLAVFFTVGRKGDGRTAAADSVTATPIERQQVPGDRTRVEAAKAGAFSDPADAFLARFAEPGRPFSAPECDWPKQEEFKRALSCPLTVASDEFTESIDLKRIVTGMKREMGQYLAGGGYVSGYIRELVRRQQTEIDARESAEKKLRELLAPPAYRSSSGAESAANLERQLKEAYEFWLNANAQLSSMGIAPIPVPMRLLGYQRKMGLKDPLKNLALRA